MLNLLGRVKKGMAAAFLLTVMSLSNLRGAVYATSIGLPAPQQLLAVSQAYSLPLLKGVKVNPQNPLQIDFIIDNGNQGKVDQEEAGKLIRYFLAGLTMSEKDLWVNLSPYESNRVVPEVVGKTDLGRDMLAQDYILKQLSASLTHPDTELGKQYWNAVNGVGANTFNKIWIAPATAKVYEHGNIALVHEAKLKAMLEKDCLAMRKNNVSVGSRPASTSIKGQAGLAPTGNTDSFKAQIIPVIENEINNGKNFAQLRQIYYSLIMAKWFKEKFKASFYKDYINQKKVGNIDIHDPQAKEKIYTLYTEAFIKGVYNIIKTEQNSFKRTKRAYFSGGIAANVTPVLETTVVASDAALAVTDQPIGTQTLVSAGWQAKECIDRNKAWSIAQEILGEIKRKQENFRAHGDYKILGVSDRFLQVSFSGQRGAFEWNAQRPLHLDVNLQQVTSMVDLRKGLEARLGSWYRCHLAEFEDARASDVRLLAASREGEEQYQDAMDQGFVGELRIKKDERVLDVGTRLGNIAAVASRYSDHVTGIDISRKILQKAQKIHADNKKISFEVADIAERGIKSGSADVVTVAYVLSGNLSFDRLTALERLNDVLKAGGRIGILDYSTQGGGPEMWSKEEWKQVLTKAGFSNIRIGYYKQVGFYDQVFIDQDLFVIYAEKNQTLIIDHAGKSLGGVTMDGIKVKAAAGSLPMEFAGVGPEFFNTAMLKIISMRAFSVKAELR